MQLSKTLPEKTLFYFDPPYYKKGKDLYINFYEHQDHLQISKLISEHESISQNLPEGATNVSNSDNESEGTEKGTKEQMAEKKERQKDSPKDKKD